jgi:peptide/nickel transport system substrate-binding protein
LATTYVGRIVFAGLCDKLFDIDEQLKIVPQLATGYEWADDRTLVIHLRSGVKFQNGEVLDAAAVKYSLERHLTMQGSYRKGEINSIDHVDVVDPATARIVQSSVRRVPGATTDGPGFTTQGDRAAGRDSPASGVQRPLNLSSACTGPYYRPSVLPTTGAPRTSFRQVVYQVLVDPSLPAANLKAGTSTCRNITANDAPAVKAGSKAETDPVGRARLFGISNNVNGTRANNPCGQNALFARRWTRDRSRRWSKSCSTACRADRAEPSRPARHFSTRR